LSKRKARPRPDEVFISHASRDRSFADKLAVALRRHGINVWYSRTNLRGAQQWHDEIGSALQRCNWFVIILSKSAIKSMWVKRELVYVLRQSRYKDRIVPVVYRECDPDRLSWTLRSFQMVDFKGGFDSGCHDLLNIWGIGYQP
jgi:hypothetical protein